MKGFSHSSPRFAALVTRGAGSFIRAFSVVCAPVQVPPYRL